MKKIILSLVIFSVLVFGGSATTAQAFTLEEARAQIEILKTQIVQLRSMLGGQALQNNSSVTLSDPTPFTVDLKVNGSDGPITVDYKSKITASWTSTGTISCGPSGNWVPLWPGTSGLWNNTGGSTSGSVDLMAAFAENGDLNQIKYLDKIEIGVDCWRANGGIIGRVTKVTDTVVINLKESTPLDPTPRIMYWWGKVNQHVDAQGNWLTDPDGTSGASIDKLTYCKKWFPNTTSVETYKTETVMWRAAGNTGAYPYAQVSDKCVQGTTTTTPLVTVLSPNGGEVFTAGQQITIKWKTSGIPAGNNALIILNDTVNNYGGWDITTPNDGEETFTLPTTGLTFGKNFVIRVSFAPFGGFIGTQLSDASNNTFTIQASTTTPLDPTPRIAYWWGKVNQRVDAQGNWLTDPDGVSGANLDKLTYCKKWYPNTTRVEPYKSEMINTWRARGNTGEYSFAVVTDRCVQGTVVQKPSVNVLSPNGGEVYNAGQTITVKWETKNIPTTVKANILILDENSGYHCGSNGFRFTVANDGEEVFTLPTIETCHDLKYGKNFKIRVAFESFGGYYEIDLDDLSDNLFTIQAPATSTCAANATPSINVLSPKGGESYGAGQKVFASWSTCNIASSNKMELFLNKQSGFAAVGPISLGINDSVETVTLPQLGTTSSQLTPGAWEVTISTEVSSTTPGAIQSANGKYYILSTIKPVIVIQGNTNLPAGCTSAAGYSSTSGQPCFTTGGSSSVDQVPPGLTGREFSFTRGLKLGLQGEDVKALQEKLKAEGIYSGALTGYYGPMTRRAVQKYQENNNLPPVGVVGPKTLELLND